MQFMKEYFKNEIVYKLPNRHTYSSWNRGHMAQFWGK